MSKVTNMTTHNAVELARTAIDIERAFISLENGKTSAFLATACKREETAIRRLVRELNRVTSGDFGFSEDAVIGRADSFKEKFTIEVTETETCFYVMIKERLNEVQEDAVNVLSDTTVCGVRKVIGTVNVSKEHKAVVIPGFCKAAGISDRLFCGLDGMPLFGKDFVEITTDKVRYGYKITYDSEKKLWLVKVLTNLNDFVQSHTVPDELAKHLYEECSENALQCLELARAAFSAYGTEEIVKAIINTTKTVKGEINDIKLYKKNLGVEISDFLIGNNTTVKQVKAFREKLETVHKFGKEPGVFKRKQVAPGTENVQFVYEKVVI